MINYDFGIIYSVFVFFCETYVVRHVGGWAGRGCSLLYTYGKGVVLVELKLSFNIEGIYI